MSPVSDSPAHRSASPIFSLSLFNGHFRRLSSVARLGKPSAHHSAFGAFAGGRFTRSRTKAVWGGRRVSSIYFSRSWEQVREVELEARERDAQPEGDYDGGFDLPYVSHTMP